MNEMSKWLAVCDFDGTLVNDDMTDLILENFADSSWKNIENDWINNKISAKQCMQQQIQLLSTRISKNFLADFCKNIQLQPGVYDFFQYRNANNLPTIIVSDGVDFVIEQILIANGINKNNKNNNENENEIQIPIFSNRLCYENLPNNQTKFDLHFPLYNPDCIAKSGLCKCKVAKNYMQGCQQSKFFLIGDGLSDVCLAKQANFVFCRKNYKLSKFCKQQNLHFMEFENFSEIYDYLQV